MNKKTLAVEGDLLPQEEAVSAPDSHAQLMLPASVLPATLHLLPLSERPFFPAQTLPLRRLKTEDGKKSERKSESNRQ